MYYTKEYYVPKFKYELEEILSKWYPDNKDFRHYSYSRLLAIYHNHRRQLNGTDIFEKVFKEEVAKVSQGE
ncbi:hypothetical protein CCP1ISM_50042 [Azospirillaceae bacterium]